MSELRCAVRVKYTWDLKKKKTIEVSLKYTDYMLKQYFGYTGLNRIIKRNFTCLKNFVTRLREHVKLHVAHVIFLLGQGAT